jgi:hypothetical protein
VWEGTFTVFGVTLHCAVLNDGRRVINADDVERFLAAMADASATDAGEIEALARWQREKTQMRHGRPVIQDWGAEVSEYPLVPGEDADL